MARGWWKYTEYITIVLLNCVLVVVHNASLNPEDTEPLRFPPKFNFTLNQPETCNSETFLVIFVSSTVHHFDQRKAIRDTWANEDLQRKHRMKVLFILGAPSGKLWPDGVFETVTAESQKHKDIIQINCPDTYQNLTLKSVAMLQWMDTYCKDAQFLFKTDDDMFINTDNLLKDLHYTVHKYFVMGHIIAGAKPMRDISSKYYTPESVYKKQTYPSYISGTGYVVSGDLIHHLYTIALQTPIFWLEDIYITGICAHNIEASFIFNGKFGYLKRDFDPCVYKDIITGHELSGGEIRTMWRMIHDSKLDCSLPPIDSYD